MPISASAHPGSNSLIVDVITKPFTLAEIKFSVAAALAKGRR